MHRGERPDEVKLVPEGWVSRYTCLEDGRRQIIAYLVPPAFAESVAA